jgi:hypothetical protein
MSDARTACGDGEREYCWWLELADEQFEG